MDQYLAVNVVTPAGLICDHHAAVVAARTTINELEILPKHVPIIAPLTIDEIRVKRTDSDTRVDWIAANGGIMEVCDSVASVVADSAEREHDVDASCMERTKQHAECQTEGAKAKQDTNELKRVAVALHRAINRIKVSKYS